MDNNFQTSFIPKKALSEERVAPPGKTSLFSFLATIIFFAALASAAGMYFYKASIQKNLDSMTASLAAAQNEFEATDITQLETLSRRMAAVKTLLANHIAVTPIFAALQDSTLKTVQYTKFSYTFPTDSGGAIEVQMSGRAQDYTSIALESDNLTSNKNIQNPIFSNLALEPQTGDITFDLVFDVAPSFVLYANNVPTVAATATSPTPPSATQNGATHPNPFANPSQ